MLSRLGSRRAGKIQWFITSVDKASVITTMAPVEAESPPTNAKTVRLGDSAMMGTPSVKYCAGRGTASSKPAHRMGNMGRAINSKNSGKAQVTVRVICIMGFTATPIWKICGMVTAEATKTRNNGCEIGRAHV